MSSDSSSSSPASLPGSPLSLSSSESKHPIRILESTHVYAIAVELAEEFVLRWKASNGTAESTYAAMLAERPELAEKMTRTPYEAPPPLRGMLADTVIFDDFAIFDNRPARHFPHVNVGTLGLPPPRAALGMAIAHALHHEKLPYLNDPVPQMRREFSHPGDRLLMRIICDSEAQKSASEYWAGYTNSDYEAPRLNHPPSGRHFNDDGIRRVDPKQVKKNRSKAKAARKARKRNRK